MSYRPGLTVRLFLAVLATATLATVLMGAASFWSFSRGFLGFLNAQAVTQMEGAIPRLVQEYREHGSWNFIKGRPGAWFRMTRPLQADGSDDPWGDPERMASDLLGAGRRLSLLDEQRQFVIGFPQLFDGTEYREIVLEGRTVGWITLAPVEAVTDAAAVRFGQSQERATLAIGGLALVLATLVAWWVARALLAPVREVARATHRLAAGHHDTRVPERGGQDEVAQLARDFNQLALTLQRNEQMRREYMADISHELRTPLAVLRGEIEALQDGIHPVTPQALALLHGEVHTLGQLVGDLHELALADVGALRYRKAPLDLAALLDREGEAFQARAAERGLTLQVQAGAALTVEADAERLGQLLHNLLDNAVRYTDAGGLLRLSLQTEDRHAVIDLQDSAPGVAPELLPRLFERFFRVEASRGRRTGGSGLGLAICRQIVTAHGGHIEARPSPLGGVWIQVRLPLTETPA
ncbi:ATP-binding protein [Ideonella livida]|uniref:histidine kinase n=1 Tax=Ideonella livida TaxID=2707176 RepID=A0A7C9PFH4_9BURK|nr:ATP-binding protein [Ideonella livida]NDY90388.1 HAMP domain-containing protein [Ideonella livida]